LRSLSPFSGAAATHSVQGTPKAEAPENGESDRKAPLRVDGYIYDREEMRQLM